MKTKNFVILRLLVIGILSINFSCRNRNNDNNRLKLEQFKRIEEMFLRHEAGYADSLKQLDLSVLAGKITRNDADRLRDLFEGMRNDSKMTREKIKKYEQEIYPPKLKGEGR
mgnify:CR=1 FL=1